MPIAEIFEPVQDTTTNTPGYRLLKRINDIWRIKRKIQKKRTVNDQSCKPKAKNPRCMNLTVNASKSLLHATKLPELNLANPSYCAPLKIKLLDSGMNIQYVFDATLEAGVIKINGLCQPSNTRLDMLSIIGYFFRDISTEDKYPPISSNTSTCNSKLQEIFKASKLSKTIFKLIFHYLKLNCKDSTLLNKCDMESIASRHTVELTNSNEITITPVWLTHVRTLQSTIPVTVRKETDRKGSTRVKYRKNQSSIPLFGKPTRHTPSIKKCKQLLPLKSKQEIMAEVSTFRDLNINVIHEKIEKLKTTHDRYQSHPINQLISLFNECSNYLRQKPFAISSEAISDLSDAFSVPLSTIALSQKRNDELIKTLKQKMYSVLQKVITSENMLNINTNGVSMAFYKFYIKGTNNTNLVKLVLRKRWWWVLLSKEEKAHSNFYWTDWKKQKVFNNMFKEKTHRELNDTSQINTMENSIVNEEHSPKEFKIYNHIEFGNYLSNKKWLFLNMNKYYTSIGENPFDYTPVTYHITHIDQIEEFANEKKIWIIKPGENTNRGKDIEIADNKRDLTHYVSELLSDKTHTAIVQEYIVSPYLIMNRKFDIRCYGLITHINSLMKGYYFRDGYIRTSSKEFNLENLDSKYIHLTNDAIQKNSIDYGKYESGNKISYQDFQKYIESEQKGNGEKIFNGIISSIKKTITDSYKAIYHRKAKSNPSYNTFEVCISPDIWIRLHDRLQLQSLSDRGQH